VEGRQKQVIEAYQRVQDFLAAHPVPPPWSYGLPKALLDDVVERLSDHSTDQVAGRRLSRAETQRQKALRKTLRELHLRPISKIAKVSLAEAPGIQKALVMPAPQLSTTKLISEAKGMRDAVAGYTPVFVRNGRPEDFVEALDAAIEELRQSQLGRARNVGKGVGAKAGLTDEIRRGRQAVEMVDAIVTTAFASNGDVLARWRIARRVQGLPGGGGVSATGGTADENVAPPQAA
jgi:hypothetical protein